MTSKLLPRGGDWVKTIEDEDEVRTEDDSDQEQDEKERFCFSSTFTFTQHNLAPVSNVWSHLRRCSKLKGNLLNEKNSRITEKGRQKRVRKETLDFPEDLWECERQRLGFGREVVENYSGNLVSLEKELRERMLEEKVQKELESLERSIKEAEDSVTKKHQRQRLWFQNKAEKTLRKNGPKLSDGKEESRVRPTTEDRIPVEILKASGRQARHGKNRGHAKDKKITSSFEEELANTSKAKLYRYEATAHEKMQMMKCKHRCRRKK